MVYNEFYKAYVSRVKQVDTYLDKCGVSIYVATEKHYDFGKDMITVTFKYDGNEYTERVSVSLMQKNTVVSDVSEQLVEDKTFLATLGFDKSIIDRLRTNGIHTVGQLRQLGYEGIVLLPRISEQKAVEIVEKCKDLGIVLVEKA